MEMLRAQVRDWGMQLHGVRKRAGVSIFENANAILMEGVCGSHRRSAASRINCCEVKKVSLSSLQTELYLIIYRAHFVLWKSNRLLQVDLLGKFWENNQKMQSYFPQNYLTVSCQIFKVNYKSAKWGMEPETSFTVVFGTEQQKSDMMNNSITLIQCLICFLLQQGIFSLINSVRLSVWIT